MIDFEPEHPTISADINVPAYSKITVTATAQTYEMSIPFTATRHSLFYDGVTRVEKVNGHVKNVVTDSMKVTYGQILPLTTDPPEDAEDETSDDTDAVTKANEAILGSKIIYNLQYPAELIWSTGSAHNYPGAFYRMRVHEPDCALGDTFVPEKPILRGSDNKLETEFLGNNKSPVIRKIETDTAVKPKEFKQIFSGAGLTVYKLVPPSDDYVCLGDVVSATNSVLTESLKERYCCVKKKYTVLASPKWQWNFKGDPGGERGQLWGMRRTMDNAQFETYGINSGNFYFQSNTNNPGTGPTDDLRQLIGDDYDVRESKLIGFDDEKPLTLIEVDCHKLVGDVTKMGSFLDTVDDLDNESEWATKTPLWVKSGKDFNPTIYKPESREGYYPLGHYASWDVEEPKDRGDRFANKLNYSVWAINNY